jgi:thymidylate synthase ThyX
MTNSAKIICHSISEAGVPLTTMQLRYPRFIHAEVMTHRVLSRNASSSRAIPVERLIKDIREDTAMPLHWGKNQPGMQAEEECNSIVPVISYEYLKGQRLEKGISYMGRDQAWFRARDYAISVAEAFHKAGYHKQIVNRLLEPFSYINVVVTSTEWSNFFELRDHPDAQPEIMVLAQAMKKAMAESTPKLLREGEWHLPYVNDLPDIEEFLRKEGKGYEWKELIETAIKCSVARCARVSYLTHDMKPPDIAKDIELYDKLITSKPIHASPAEHQARPTVGNEDIPSFTGNFSGWVQYRKLIEFGN